MTEIADPPAPRREALRWALLLAAFALGAFALSGVLVWPRDGWTLFGVLPVSFFLPYLISVIVRAVIAARQPVKQPQPILDRVVDVTQLAWVAAVFVHVAAQAGLLRDWPRMAAAAAVIALACAGYIRVRLAKTRVA